MAAKLRHTIWMILCIHKTVSVIHVIRGFRGHIIHFYWYYVHLTSLEPIFCFLNKMPKIRPDRLPPPQIKNKNKTKKLHFHTTKWLFDATKSTRSPHFRHPTLIGHYTNFWPLLIWTLLPNLTFYPIVQGFHRTYATGAACQKRTLTPPDTWSCPTLGLACVLMSRPISPELVLSPDFWISNIPRYFSFAP